MRNFSTVSSNNVVTYHINFDEYYGTNFYPAARDFCAEPISVVLERLAVAFETPLATVTSAFKSIASLGWGACTGLNPSEEMVLRNLYDFWSTNIVDQDAEKSNCTVFSYINLNTGAVVSWIYVVL